MAEFPFYTDINLNDQEVLNFVVHTAASDSDRGDGVQGQMYYETTNNLLKLWDSSNNKWVVIGSLTSIDGVNGVVPIIVTPSLDSSNNPIPGQVDISINAVVASTGGENTTTTPGTKGAIIPKDKEKLDTVEWNAAADQISSDVPHTTSTDDTDEGNSDVLTNVEAVLHALGVSLYDHKDTATTRSIHNELKFTEKVAATGIGNGQDDDGNNLPGGSDSLWGSEKQIIDYVKSMVSSSGRPAKAFDPTDSAQAGSNNLPLKAYGHGNEIKTGDQFIVSKDGQIGPTGSEVDVHANDVLIAKSDLGVVDGDSDSGDGTQEVANWDLILGQHILDATKTTKGVTQITGTTEMDAIITDPNYGTKPGDDFKHITAAMLQYYMGQSRRLHYLTKDFLASDDNGVLTHNWGNMHNQVNAYITGTGVEIHGQVERTADSVKVSFNITPPSAWTIMCIGEDLTNTQTTP